MDKVLIWGAMPLEKDGGAIVTYYQLQRMHEINNDFEFHIAPKVWQQADPNYLPFAKWHELKYKYFGHIPNNITKIMKKHKIQWLILWHIPWEYFTVVDRVHRLGGKVLNWQTIHWENDVLFMSPKLNKIDWWVPPTQYAEDTLVKTGGLDRERMTRIYHAVDTRRFFPYNTEFLRSSRNKFRNELGIKDNQKMILFTGRCQLTKGIVPTMLAGRKLVKNFDCVMVFKAGIHDGIYKSKEIGYLLSKMAKWDKRIVFLKDWTSPTYMEQLAGASDIVVVPSAHEGFSLTGLEGMACEKPVAWSDIPVHRELAGGANGKCGLLMPVSEHTEYVNDVQSVKVPNRDMVYGTLKFLLENPDESKEMGREGLNRTMKYYDMNKICKQWFDLFRRLDDD